MGGRTYGWMGGWISTIQAVVAHCQRMDGSMDGRQTGRKNLRLELTPSSEYYYFFLFDGIILGGRYIR